MGLIELNTEQEDEVALAVIDRYKRSRDYRSSHIVHQGCSAQMLMERARHQYRREYMPDDAAMLQESFGFCPTRYYGVTQQKVNATYYWKLDLVINKLDAMFTVDPTPNPDIDVATKKKIREGVRRELIARMEQANIVDPLTLMTSSGKLDPRIEEYLQEQAQALKKVEQARIVSVASQAAKRTQVRMRDNIVEGDFRQAYSDFSFDQVLYGRGVMRYPYMQVKPVRYHTNSGGISRRWENVPTFKHVNIFEFFPVDDAKDLETNTGNTERTCITKQRLIDLVRLKNTGYNKQVINEILEDFAFKERNWIEPEDNPDSNSGDVWWGLDESIPMLIHEGYFTGKELAEYGITKVDSLEYVNARVEVVGGRTIRCELIESKEGTGRTYFQSPFNKCGSGLYDALGIAAMVWDTEQRINRLMHLFEHNVDWASRPPMLRNRSAYDNPNDAEEILPGGQYDVEERFGTTGSMPDAARPVKTVSAQYQLIMSQVGQLLQLADNDTGIPAFAYGTSSNFGRSSLGEFTQRVSGSLRTVKGLAMHEDFYFIEPCFTQMFDDLLDSDPELRVGSDINVVVRGMTGLLNEDMKESRQQEILPLILQGGQQGLVPPQVSQYAVRQMLESAGFPVDELGMSDPIMDNAIAVAAGIPVTTAGAASQQAPTLDGRSGPIPQANYASPEGLNQDNLAQIGPMESS